MWLNLHSLDRPGFGTCFGHEARDVYMDAILMRTRLALFEIWGMRLDFVLGRPGYFVVCLGSAAQFGFYRPRCFAAWVVLCKPGRFGLRPVSEHVGRFALPPPGWCS